MYCTKCGKEIPEGENKICEDCQKKLLDELDELENEEKNENVVEETKEETKSEEPSKKEKKCKKGKFIYGIIIVAIIIAIALVSLKFFVLDKGVGNTIGNIRNYGYAAISGDYIYYLSPNEDSSKVGIFKVKQDGSDKQQLYMGEKGNEVVSINAFGNYVYFILLNSNTESSESGEVNEIDNKIYRMKNDGSSLEIINDNEFNDNCYEIYVIDGKIYYIDVNSNVSKMNLDGSNREVVSENGTGFLGINQEYIIYNVEVEKEETQGEEANAEQENFDSTEAVATYVTYIADINGQNARPIIEGKRILSVNIEGEYIYYTNEEKKICRTKIDSNQEEVIAELEAYNLNVADGFAYYLNYKDIENQDYTVCVYKIDLNAETKEPVIVKELETYSVFLNVVNGKIIYMDSNDTSGFINMVDSNGENEVQLYFLDYTSFYGNLSDVNPDSDTDTDVEAEVVTE